MTELTINIENQDMVNVLKKLLTELNGVTVSKIRDVRRTLSPLEQSLEEAREGKVSGPFASVDELMRHLTE